jgi:H+/Cl- antiporter ClcA
VNTLYLIIGIVCGVAGFLMLFVALSDSPFLKHRKKQIRNDSYDQHSFPPGDGGPYGH